MTLLGQNWTLRSMGTAARLPSSLCHGDRAIFAKGSTTSPRVRAIRAVSSPPWARAPGSARPICYTSRLDR